MLGTGAREQMCSETEALEKSVEDLASGSLFLIQDSGTTFL